MWKLKTVAGAGLFTPLLSGVASGQNATEKLTKDIGEVIACGGACPSVDVDYYRVRMDIEVEGFERGEFFS